MDDTPIQQDVPAAGSSVPGTTTPFMRIFNRIFSRHMLNTALLMLTVLFFTGNLLVPAGLLLDPDLWWHLADARILCVTHHFSQVGPYSFTVATQPWIDPEWLAEMPYWFGYQTMGLAGIYVVTGLALFANLLFVYWRGYWISRHAGAALWTAVIGFSMMTINAGARAIVIAYLALSAEMAILEAAERGNTRRLWLLPPLFLVWVNTHGSWLIGLGLLVLYILCGLFPVKAGVFEQAAFSARDRNRLLQVLLASVAVLIVNPYGWRMVWNPIDMILNQKLNIANVQEWQPLNLTWIAGKGLMAAIALMVIANGMRGRKWKVFELALVFFACYAAFDHARFAFLAAVLIIPMLAGDVARSFFRKPDTKTIPAMNALMVVASLCLLAYLAPTQAKLKKAVDDDFPMQSIATIQPSWRTFHTDNLGGMMDFESKPNFIDSRFDTYEHHGVLKDFLDIMQLHDSLQLLDKYRIDHILIQKRMPLSYLLEHTQGWRVQRREGKGDYEYQLFARIPGAAGTSAACVPAPAAVPH